MLCGIGNFHCIVLVKTWMSAKYCYIIILHCSHATLAKHKVQLMCTVFVVTVYKVHRIVIGIDIYGSNVQKHRYQHWYTYSVRNFDVIKPSATSRTGPEMA